MYRALYNLILYFIRGLYDIHILRKLCFVIILHNRLAACFHSAANCQHTHQCASLRTLLKDALNRCYIDVSPKIFSLPTLGVWYFQQQTLLTDHRYTVVILQAAVPFWDFSTAACHFDDGGNCIGIYCISNDVM